LFLSGIQHYAESPEGMAEVPEAVKNLLRTLPDYWDDVAFIDGYPGKYVVIARRSGNRWYVAGINGDTTERKVTLDLASFRKSKATLYTEGANGTLFSKTELSTSNRKQDLTLKINGGFVMVIE